MTRDIFNKFLSGFQNKGSHIGVNGRWKATIIRSDGSIEGGEWIENVVTSAGLNLLASRAIANTSSAFAYMAVGTVTAAASLGSTNFGEVSRKTPTTIASSGEVFFAVMTWGGAADSVTSVVLESAALVNHASSGQGTVCNIVTGVSATLADSDFLHLEVQVQVGSHAL